MLRRPIDALSATHSLSRIAVDAAANTDENGGATPKTLTPTKRADRRDGTDLLQAGKVVVTRSLSVRASTSQQLLVIDSPATKRATPTQERARPPAAKRRLRVLEDLDSTAVDAEPAAPLAAPTGPAPIDPSPAVNRVAVPAAAAPVEPTAAAVPSLFDDDGFLKEDVWDSADAEVRGRVWADAAAWCTAWSNSIHQPAAQARRARWSAALDVPRVRSELQLLAKFKPGVYEQDDGLLMSLYETSSEEALATLRQDMPRTFPSHALFLSDTYSPHAQPAENSNHVRPGMLRRSLYHILASYAAFDRDVGYCQGMSYVVATILMFADEEDAFWLLVALLKSPDHFVNCYDPALSGLLVLGQVFGELLQQIEPAVADHVRAQGVNELMYVSPWFMRLFTGFQPWPSAVWMFDQCIQGGFRAALKLSLGLMHANSERLLGAGTINELLPVLQELSVAPLVPAALEAAMAEVAPALASASLQDLIEAARRDLAARARRRRRRATVPTAPTAAVTTPQTVRRATAPAAPGVTPQLQTPQPAVSTVWQRLQATLAATTTPATATPRTSSKAAEGVDELAAAALAAAAAAVSPEAPGPGQLARLVTATPSFREFATPTPSKRRRLERDESVPRELADLGAAPLIASPPPPAEH